MTKLTLRYRKGYFIVSGLSEQDLNCAALIAVNFVSR
jgi:hypothetical protein